jgi:hypothetical protein
MLHTLLPLTLGASLAAFQVGDAEGGPPRTPPPVVMVAIADGQGQVYIERTVTRYVPETRTVTVKVGDRLEQRAETVRVPVYVQSRIALTGKGIQVYGSDGKRIDAKEIPRLLKKTSAVFVSADGRPVDPFYLRLVRQGGLIVVAPELAGPALPPVRPPEEIPPPKKTPAPNP